MFYALLCFEPLFCNMTTPQAILMADVVRSRNIDARPLSRHLKTTTAAANRVSGSGIKSPLTVTLGNEFQGVCRSIADGINIILWREHRLRAKPLMIDGKGKSYGLRYVLYEGVISTPFNRDRAHGMLGPGLTEPRQRLNQKERKQPRIQIELQDTVLSRRFR